MPPAARHQHTYQQQQQLLLRKYTLAAGDLPGPPLIHLSRLSQRACKCLERALDNVVAVFSCQLPYVQRGARSVGPGHEKVLN